ncbi:MAG: lipoprotein-releasing ABC transporter permease subunit [Planktomarina sp.]|jgi:lipoprotein-releasing system permease protein|nr:lipoprotein-releasing ABC transporter permease subunit [Planktomarina sp.]MDT2017317.1 lipoprotein-releasing ABC transporter permease subunit [Planktomarina sp.]|tara:strand:+ start:1623 stop:2906 length:1284 start_codon:yes stop_codon:yes gene_type:complete
MKRMLPFSSFEFLIAWRYLRAKRSEGGISVMTLISMIGIALAVAALIIVLAVRSGFRTEFVDAILGANAHVTVFEYNVDPQNGKLNYAIKNYNALTEKIAKVPGVKRAAPIIRNQVMANSADFNTGVVVYGISLDNLKSIPNIAGSDRGQGNIDDFENGVAIGVGVAKSLRLDLGDRIKLISPNGIQTAFGISPRVKSFTVSYIFSAGHYEIDQTRLYMTFKDAQSFFDREGLADEIEVFIDEPELVERFEPSLKKVISENVIIETWRDYAGGFLRALAIEDNVMLVIMIVLILLSTMNIISGLIMLVKNKGKDIGILRTMGLTRGSILRIFFLCGAGIGLVGTVLGVIVGILFVLNIDAIFSVVNYVSGGEVWDPSIRGIYHLPSELRGVDVLKAVGISLSLSFVITIFPARRAARMDPVEALRNE